MTPADLQAARELAQQFTMQLGCGVRDDDDAKCVIDYLCVNCKKKGDAAALLTRLADEVEALRKDAERLNWAEQQWNEVLIAGLFCDWEFDGKRYPTGARAAIDAAMKEQGNG